ncbi:MAG: peptidoglycan editing factor PgeF [Ruminococcaceae bacterium]|nr:peptidoglycan editing factor PgeF [Oscillospiraceae bacterium]
MFIKSKILRSVHAFSTREGGVSSLEHTKSLNLAFGRGDSDEIVLKNLKIFAEEIGIDPHSVISVPQIHSDVIYRVGRADAGEGYYQRVNIREGDGYITDEKGITLGVKAADCVPILFEAEKRGEVIAVGAVHAGWRGSVAGIAAKCVSMLCGEYGVSPSDIRAVIGPCIHKCCYEVGEDLRKAVERQLGGNIADLFVIPRADVENKYFCDLVGLNRHLLLEAGILSENLEVIDLCTCCHPEIFFSHRFSKGKRGTMLNVISIGL